MNVMGEYLPLLTIRYMTAEWMLCNLKWIILHASTHSVAHLHWLWLLYNKLNKNKNELATTLLQIIILSSNGFESNAREMHSMQQRFKEIYQCLCVDRKLRALIQLLTMMMMMMVIAMLLTPRSIIIIYSSRLE